LPNNPNPQNLVLDEKHIFPKSKINIIMLK
jgi:hypothetical protein